MVIKLTAASDKQDTMAKQTRHPDIFAAIAALSSLIDDTSPTKKEQKASYIIHIYSVQTNFKS